MKNGRPAAGMRLGVVPQELGNADGICLKNGQQHETQQARAAVFPRKGCPGGRAPGSCVQLLDPVG